MTAQCRCYMDYEAASRISEKALARASCRSQEAQCLVIQLNLSSETLWGDCTNTRFNDRARKMASWTTLQKLKAETSSRGVMTRTMERTAETIRITFGPMPKAALLGHRHSTMATKTMPVRPSRQTLGSGRIQ